MKKVSVSNNLHYIFPINENLTYMDESKNNYCKCILNFYLIIMKYMKRIK